jgi:hypothetical protein
MRIKVQLGRHLCLYMESGAVLGEGLEPVARILSLFIKKYTILGTLVEKDTPETSMFSDILF